MFKNLNAVLLLKFQDFRRDMAKRPPTVALSSKLLPQMSAKQKAA